MKKNIRINRLGAYLLLNIVIFLAMTCTILGDSLLEDKTIASTVSSSLDVYKEVTLSYGEYCYIWWTEEQLSGSTVDWSFMGSNSNVGITAMVMNDAEFYNFDHGYSYNYYPLSPGSYYNDSGTFTLPYTDHWIFVFWNNHFVQQTTTLFIIIYISPQYAYFGDLYYETYDSNMDGYDDGVKAVFDPDLTRGGEDYADVTVYLKKQDGTTVNWVSDSIFCIGAQTQYFSIDLGTVDEAGTYYIYGEICVGTIACPEDTASTPYFELYAPILLASLSSIDYETYDPDGDGRDDSVRAIFDPDLPTGASDSVEVTVVLVAVANEEVVNGASDYYYVTGDDYDRFTLDLGSVDEVGEYYIVYGVYYSSEDEADDMMASADFYLSGPSSPTTHTTTPTITTKTTKTSKDGDGAGFIPGFELGGVIGGLFVFALWSQFSRRQNKDKNLLSLG